MDGVVGWVVVLHVDASDQVLPVHGVRDGAGEHQEDGQGHVRVDGHDGVEVEVAAVVLVLFFQMKQRGSTE